MTVHEGDGRQVGVALEAEVTRSPLREELPAEAVEALDLEEAVAAQQQPAQQPVAVLGAQHASEQREVEGELGDLVLLRPGEGLNDQKLHQAVRRVEPAAHRRERVAVGRR